MNWLARLLRLSYVLCHLIFVLCAPFKWAICIGNEKLWILWLFLNELLQDFFLCCAMKGVNWESNYFLIHAFSGGGLAVFVLFCEGRLKVFCRVIWRDLKAPIKRFFWILEICRSRVTFGTAVMVKGEFWLNFKYLAQICPVKLKF